MQTCGPVDEGGAGIKDLNDIKKAFHMKFVWCLITDNILWSNFFNAKYLRTSHFAIAKITPFGSRFWKAVLKVFPEVYANIHVRLEKERHFSGMTSGGIMRPLRHLLLKSGNRIYRLKTDGMVMGGRSKN